MFQTSKAMPDWHWLLGSIEQQKAVMDMGCCLLCPCHGGSVRLHANSEPLGWRGFQQLVGEATVGQFLLLAYLGQFLPYDNRQHHGLTRLPQAFG